MGGTCGRRGAPTYLLRPESLSTRSFNTPIPISRTLCRPISCLAFVASAPIRLHRLPIRGVASCLKQLVSAHRRLRQSIDGTTRTPPGKCLPEPDKSTIMTYPYSGAAVLWPCPFPCNSHNHAGFNLPPVSQDRVSPSLTMSILVRDDGYIGVADGKIIPLRYGFAPRTGPRDRRDLSAPFFPFWSENFPGTPPPNL